MFLKSPSDTLGIESGAAVISGFWSLDVSGPHATQFIVETHRVTSSLEIALPPAMCRGLLLICPTPASGFSRKAYLVPVYAGCIFGYLRTYLLGSLFLLASPILEWTPSSVTLYPYSDPWTTTAGPLLRGPYWEGMRE